jgi:hypothetical protein
LRDGELIPKSQAAPLPQKSGPFFLPDIQPFVTQDGHEISSRSALRAYEIRNGVKQIGNDCAPPNRRGHNVREI